MLKLTKKQLFKILTNYILLAITAAICYNVKEILPPPRKRSFRCSDKSLAKPFVDDTVPPNLLYILGIYFPILLIVIGEFFSSFVLRKASTKNSGWIVRYVLKCLIIMTLFMIGLIVERLYKNVAKVTMARLRPNFITVCQPVSLEGYKCDGVDDTTVMAEYNCNSNSYPSWEIKTAFLSFPSGHTSLTAYSMVFLICYLYLLFMKLRHFQNYPSLFVLILQALCFFIIIFVGMSRVLDFRHHWSDVFAGFIGGASIALIINYYLKSQMDNIEEWLRVTTSHTEEDIENGQFVYENKNVNEKKETCSIELVNK